MLLLQLSIVACVIFIFMTMLFVVSVLIGRNDIADVAWGTGILLVALVSYATTPEPSTLQLLLLVFAALWGLRLTVRIGLRNWKKGEEDVRYRKWRETWSWFYLRSYFQVFLLQGALMLVIGYPFVHASVYGSDASLGVFVYVGALVWLVGYFFEVIGDWQLDRFLQDPANKGRVMQSGLWKYSRHPNYFGEVTMWWGIWLMVLLLPLGFVALISPVTITYLILYVSGVPMLEEHFARNSEFEAYKKRTSKFFPLPPKQEHNTQ